MLFMYSRLLWSSAHAGQNGKMRGIRGGGCDVSGAVDQSYEEVLHGSLPAESWAVRGETHRRLLRSVDQDVMRGWCSALRDSSSGSGDDLLRLLWRPILDNESLSLLSSGGLVPRWPEADPSVPFPMVDAPRDEAFLAVSDVSLIDRPPSLCLLSISSCVALILRRSGVLSCWMLFQLWRRRSAWILLWVRSSLPVLCLAARMLPPLFLLMSGACGCVLLWGGRPRCTSCPIIAVLLMMVRIVPTAVSLADCVFRYSALLVLSPVRSPRCGPGDSPADLGVSL